MHLKCLLDLKDTQQGNFKSVMWHFIKDRENRMLTLLLFYLFFSQENATGHLKYQMKKKGLCLWEVLS